MIKQRLLAMVISLFIFSSLSLAVARSDVRAISGGGAAYGNITLESKNPKQIYDQVLKICRDLKVTVVSYNCYTQPPSGKTQISAQLQVDKDKAADLMSQFATLAEVRNQNLSQNYGQNPDQLKKQLEDLDQELKSLVGGRYPVLFAYGLQQRQNLQAQLQQIENTSNFTTITLSIQEPNQDQPASKLHSIDLSMALYAAAAVAVGFFLAKCSRGAKS